MASLIYTRPARPAPRGNIYQTLLDARGRGIAYLMAIILDRVRPA